MTGLGRWTLPPSALHVRWTGREKAIQGNFYSPTMRMQGISFTPFFFFFLNTMFPNEHLAFAQFVSGEHRPCWMPSGCRETHDHFREQLCQPLPRKPGPCSLRGGAGFPAEALGRGHAGSAGGTKLGRWQRGHLARAPPRCSAPSSPASAGAPDPSLGFPLFRHVFKWQKLTEALKIIIWIIST